MPTLSPFPSLDLIIKHFINSSTSQRKNSLKKLTKHYRPTELLSQLRLNSVLDRENGKGVAINFGPAVMNQPRRIVPTFAQLGLNSVLKAKDGEER
jgi:hypothetical protein